MGCAGPSPLALDLFETVKYNKWHKLSEVCPGRSDVKEADEQRGIVARAVSYDCMKSRSRRSEKRQVFGLFSRMLGNLRAGGKAVA